MDRPRPAPRCILALTLGLAALAVGCAQSAEQEVIERYFSASRMRDNTTLANIATVAYRPSEEGIVQSFDVVNIGPEEVRTLRVRELTDAYEEARTADEAFTKRKKEYQDANIEAIDRVLRLEREGGQVRGRDAEVQAAWSKWREATIEHAGKVSEAREALEAERGIAELSVFSPTNPVDLTQYDGQLIVKDVTINASVRTPAGETVTRNLVITLQRAELTSDEGNRGGRWIITSITEAGAPPATTS